MQAHKTIIWQTNYNKKMDCPIIPHLDLAPWDGVPESSMQKAIIKIEVADGSHAPVYCKLVDLYRLGSDNISGAITLPSHGMDACDYYQWLRHQYADKDITKLAVYIYQQIKD